MTAREGITRFASIIGAPFRLAWAGLTQIANLSPDQIRSLVTVAFLMGMISLSAENWGITFAADHAAQRIGKADEGAQLLLAFLTERMRYISGLQAWLAVILGALILGADYVRLKIGDNEASLGRKDEA